MPHRTAPKRAITDAENALSADLIAMKVQLARLEALPKVLAEAVKPAEKIDSIRIHQVTGMGGGSFGNGISASVGGDKPPVNQALDSILGMAVQMPALRKLGEELGLSMEGGISGLMGDDTVADAQVALDKDELPLEEPRS
jgi:hypothetical protein